MGRASSAKKVAKAASTGESRRPGQSRFLGFPAAVIATIVLGIGLVVYAQSTRDELPSPTLSDHWHSAYGIYDCQTGEMMAPLGAQIDARTGRALDPDGIHSHDDGLIHIHPFTSSVTGSEARMKVFFETVGVEITDESLTLADGTVLSEEGTTCDGEDVTLQILRWTDASNAENSVPEVITEDLAEVQFDKDGEAFTIALAPLGAEIPVPETISRLGTVNPNLIAPDLGSGLDVEPEFDPDAEGGEGEDAPADEDAPAEDAPAEEEAPADEGEDAPAEEEPEE